MNTIEARNHRIVTQLSPDLATIELLRLDGAITAILASLGEEPRPQDVLPSDRMNRVAYLLGRNSRGEDIDLEQVLQVAGMAVNILGKLGV